MARDGLLREIQRQALEQNWRIHRCASGHPMFLAPDGLRIVVGSGTPSDRRAVNALLADLRRAGFIFRDGGRRPRRCDPPDEGRPNNTQITTQDQMEMQMETQVKEPRDSNGAPPPPERVPFYVALRRAREAEGLSRKELAEMLTLSANTIATWEVACGAVPGAASYAKLVEVFPALRNAEPPKARVSAPPANRVRRSAPQGGSQPDSLRTAMRLLMAARTSTWRSKAAALLGVAMSAGLSISEVYEWLR